MSWCRCNYIPSFWLDDENKPSPGIPATKDHLMPADIARTPSGTVHVVEPLTTSQIEQEIGRRFRDLFKPGTTVEEIQRRLERAELLKTQAVAKAELLARWKGDSDPLVIAIFMDCMVRATGDERRATQKAIEHTRKILKVIEEMGGIREPEKKEEGGA